MFIVVLIFTGVAIAAGFPAAYALFLGGAAIVLSAWFVTRRPAFKAMAGLLLTQAAR